jgi:hypothetical protein
MQGLSKPFIVSSVHSVSVCTPRTKKQYNQMFS